MNKNSNIQSSKNSEEESEVKTLKRLLLAFSMTSEVSGAISTAPDVEAIHRSLTLGLAEVLGFQRTILFRLDSSEKFMLPDTQHGFNGKKLGKTTFALDFLSGPWFDAVARKRHIIVDEVEDDDTFFALGSKSYVAFPLLSRIRNEVLNPDPQSDEMHLFTLKSVGMLWIDLPEGREITSDEVAMVSSIAAQTARAMESFRIYSRLEESNVQLRSMYDALQEAQSVIQRDLKSANRIQQSLMPEKFPRIFPDIAAHYVPNSSVGGDYYDCFQLDPNRAGLVVADVSGHGISAAMIMAMFKMLLRDNSLRYDSPSTVLEKVNDTLLRELETEHFVTCFYGIFNMENRELIWTNAGHDPIYLQSDRSTIELKSRGLFVGAFPDMKLSDVTSKLEEKQRILLYTDGIPEAFNPAKEQFGEKRLMDLFDSLKEENCADLVEEIIGALDEFTEDVPLHDDITILAADL